MRFEAAAGLPIRPRSRYVHCWRLAAGSGSIPPPWPRFIRVRPHFICLYIM
jgi:hypothetical protein